MDIARLSTKNESQEMLMKLFATFVSFLKPLHKSLLSLLQSELMKDSTSNRQHSLGKVDTQFVGQYSKGSGTNKRVLKSKIF